MCVCLYCLLWLPLVWLSAMLLACVLPVHGRGSYKEGAIPEEQTNVCIYIYIYIYICMWCIIIFISIYIYIYVIISRVVLLLFVCFTWGANKCNRCQKPTGKMRWLSCRRTNGYLQPTGKMRSKQMQWVLRPISILSLGSFGGFASSMIFTLMGEIRMSIGNFPEVLSQPILVGIILAGRLGVAPRKNGPQRAYWASPEHRWGRRRDRSVGSD